MTKRHLRIFLEVCQRQNMTRAAEALYMTQPAVSQAIRELEEHYGVLLLERFPKKLYITDPGRELMRYAQDILRLFDDADTRLGERGLTVVRLGANLSAGTALLPEYMDAYRTQYPGIRVKAYVSGSKRLLKLLADNEIDFALLEDMVLPPELNCIPFYSDKLVVVAPPDDPDGGKTLPFEAIREREFLLREPGAGVRDMFDYIMLLRNVRIDPLWESSSSTALVGAVHRGYGISVQPYLLVKEYLESGYLSEIIVSDLPLERSLNVVWYRNKILSEAAAHFVSILQERTELPSRLTGVPRA